MKSFEKCPVCGGEMVEKEVEKLLRGGNHTASNRVTVEVCLHCGERLYSPSTVERFEEIRSKLRGGNNGEFQHIGQAFQVVG